MTAMKRCEEWLNNPYFDEETKKELKAITDQSEIQDRFYRDLEFGTGGLRGILGAGTNRMNAYTVRKATQGLANYIIKQGKQGQGVAIAYDSRHMSPEFSKEAAMCLCANGIKAYRFESLRPTPELSFALRKLHCAAGIVITASHNPAEYNGYKVYWEDGAQITYPRDKEIIAEVKNVTDFHMVRTMKLEEAEAMGFYQEIGEEIDEAFYTEILSLVKNKEAIDKAKDLKIVYTPLHGTGNIPVRTILKRLGFENVYVVEEQCVPDGSFPTVKSPNPEEASAFAMALKLAKEVDADIVMGTDPDADRLGIYCKNKAGEYVSFNGNMSGSLLCEYILGQKKEHGEDLSNKAVITTIVSSNLVKAIAENYKVKCFETLTGFKYIGEYIHKFELEHSYDFVFGMEESYGCLPGTYARDKDAVGACVMLCEAAAYYYSQGLTLYEQLLNIYNKYGYYREALHTETYKGEDGAKKIQEIMERLRKNPLGSVGTCKVKNVTDYDKEGTGFVRSNVLAYELENDAWFVVRPSGTEPKIKFYTGVVGNDMQDAMKKSEQLLSDVLKEL